MSGAMAPAAVSAAESPTATLPRYSIILPCYNEEDGVARTLGQLVEGAPDGAGFEIIAVDDGSTDATGVRLREMAARVPHLKLIIHPENRGYGAAIKAGLRQAKSEVIVITDADGTYPNGRIPELVDRMGQADMVVGARIGAEVAHPLARRLPKRLIGLWVSWLAGRTVPDMNSGLRVFRRGDAERFLHLLPDGFSFTTTITLSLLLNGYDVDFVVINYGRRVGRSKFRPMRDTWRLLRTTCRTGLCFAPLRVLAPLVAVLGLLAVLGLVADLWAAKPPSGETMILGSSSLTIFLAGLWAGGGDKRRGVRV